MTARTTKREWAANASLSEVHLFRVQTGGRYWGRSVCGRVSHYDAPLWSIPEDWPDARATARDKASYRPLPVCVDCTRAQSTEP